MRGLPPVCCVRLWLQRLLRGPFPTSDTLVALPPTPTAEPSTPSAPPVGCCTCRLAVLSPPSSPAGYAPGYIPAMADDDTLDVFLLKAPVWEFKVGDILGEFVSLIPQLAAAIS